MHKHYLQIVLAATIIFFAATQARAHCEIPCGIYNDEARINLLAEHISTIEKSMQQILKLTTDKPVNYNQLLRWTMNKENHANEIQKIATQYFMTQRIKLDTQKYLQKLALMHKILVYAMKCKQTTDVAHIDTLRSLLKEFRDIYFQGNK